jgi:CheY-like chemotaxis protein
VPTDSRSSLAPSVLIVDDDRSIRRAVRSLLEGDGVVVAGEAEDGIEAVILVLKRRPSCVLLDHRMPKLDGEKTAAILRAITPQVRIVAFSSLFTRKPEWADAFVAKDRIVELPEALKESFVPEVVGS